MSARPSSDCRFSHTLTPPNIRGKTSVTRFSETPWCSYIPSHSFRTKAKGLEGGLDQDPRSGSQSKKDAVQNEGNKIKSKFKAEWWSYWAANLFCGVNTSQKFLSLKPTLNVHKVLSCSSSHKMPTAYVLELTDIERWSNNIFRTTFSAHVIVCLGLCLGSLIIWSQSRLAHSSPNSELRT